MSERRRFSPQERHFLSDIANKLDPETAHQLRNDILLAWCHQVGDFLNIDLEGYSRPDYRGHSSLPYEGTVRDLDGGLVSLLANLDQNSRILELEFIWWENDSDAGIDWATLSIVSEPR